MKVLAIDLDDTALKFPEKVNELFDDKNNFIAIYTARPDYLRRKTEQELMDKGIRYHALIMNKLRADVYIDDKNSGGLQWNVS